MDMKAAKGFVRAPSFRLLPLSDCSWVGCQEPGQGRISGTWIPPSLRPWGCCRQEGDEGRGMAGSLGRKAQSWDGGFPLCSPGSLWPLGRGQRRSQRTSEMGSIKHPGISHLLPFLMESSHWRRRSPQVQERVIH